MALFAGLMSGTSLDGVDAVLADCPVDGSVRVVAHVHLPMPEELGTWLMELQRPGDDELHRAALAANGLSRLYARALSLLCSGPHSQTLKPRAVGAHGQTVRHRPGEFDGTGYTLQLLNGALLAELCGVDVVCDFRSRDLAAAGQGAPLVPAFHGACFARAGEDVAVLNIGGIANLTLLPAHGPIRGFDCGPGNVLLDGLARRHLGQPFDRDGSVASSGVVDESLLARLLAEPFFARHPPKSTGRDLFDMSWLDARVCSADPSPPPRDLLATVTELTARSAATALRTHLGGVRRLVVCGGGAFNGHLLMRLRVHLEGVDMDSSAGSGLPPDQVEAAAFAWMAARFVRGQTASLPEVTGARGARVLGALYPAGTARP